MRKLLLLLSVFLPTVIFANSHLKEKMLVVNKQWANNPDGISLLEKTIKPPDDDAIISHLMLVEKTLRARSVNHLNTTQKKNRLKYLDILNQYWRIGKVPGNDYAQGRFPIFIDKKGVHCAVGYLLQQGGFENIAQKINYRQKFAYVHEIRVSELLQWQLESGFTINELALIQPTYQYAAYATPLGDGLRGKVMDIKKSTGKYSLIAAGSFKIDEDEDSVILAGWDGKIWNPIITAFGIINKIVVEGNIITSYGGNISFGNFINVEIVETNISNSQPTHKLMGEFNGEINDLETYLGKQYVCGKFTGGLAVKENSDWVVLPSSKIKNPTSIRTYNGKLFITGTEISKTSYSLVSFDGTNFDEKDYLPNQPAYLHVFKNRLFIGLNSENQTDKLLYYMKGSTLLRFDSIVGLNGFLVTNIITYENKMLLTGNLQSTNGMYIGNGLALYDDKFPLKANPVITVNGDVNTAILTNGNEIVIGGNFTNYRRYKGPSEPLFGCAIAYENISGKIDEPNAAYIQAPFPNPANDRISFSEAGQLFDINGKLLKEVAEGDNDISELSPGVYIYVSEKTRFRIVKK